MRAKLLVATLCVMSVTPTLTTEAQDPRARALFEEGIAHAEQERWVPALEAFRQSLDVAEMPVTLFNVASVLMRLGRMQEAVATLERYQAIVDNPRERAEADPLLEQARGAIRSVRARVDPETTTLSVDGNETPGEGTVRLLRVDPGTHLVQARAQGYAPQELELAPDALELAFTLVPELAIVMVRASEAEARILLDGTERGRGEARLELDAGSYDLRVEAEGTAPFSRRLNLDPGERVDVEAALSRNEPLWKRGWFWAVVSTVVVGVALGAILAVVLPLSAQPNGGTIGDVLRPPAM